MIALSDRVLSKPLYGEIMSVFPAYFKHDVCVEVRVRSHSSCSPKSSRLQVLWGDCFLIRYDVERSRSVESIAENFTSIHDGSVDGARLPMSTVDTELDRVQGPCHFI